MNLRPRRKLVIEILCLGLALYVGVMILESRKPAQPAVLPPAGHPQGYVFVSMLADLVRAQLGGTGGWTPNDLPLTPGFWLDNLPSYQLGVLRVVRRAAESLRDELGRAKPTDPPHPELAAAAADFAADLRRWSDPSAESMLQSGADALLRYREELGARATFSARSGALAHLIETLAGELDAVDQRLLNSSNREVVPWYKVDDNLYTAQGVAYAELGLLRAARLDFRGVLMQPHTQAALEAALKALADSEFEPWVVTNGGKSSLLANHSANLRTILENARVALTDLAGILRAGN
jgi:hypothetical protein